MWLSFSLAFALAVLRPFVPGLLFARAARFAPLQCVGFAPGISVAGYAALCLVYERIEVATSALTICGGWLLIAAVAFACSCVARRGCSAPPTPYVPNRPEARPIARWFWLPIVAAYLVVPLVAATVLFLKPMDGADAFMQAFDKRVPLGDDSRGVGLGDDGSCGQGRLLLCHGRGESALRRVSFVLP